MNMSNKTYDTLKWIAMYLLPALGTLYFTLAGIWNFPYGEQIVGTITAIDTCLGVLLGISTAQYNKKSGDTEKQLDTEREGLNVFPALNTFPFIFFCV